MGNVYTNEGPFTLEFDGKGGSTFSPAVAADRCWYEFRDGCLWKYCWVQGVLHRWRLDCSYAMLSESERPEPPEPPESSS